MKLRQTQPIEVAAANVDSRYAIDALGLSLAALLQGVRRGGV